MDQPGVSGLRRLPSGTSRRRVSVATERPRRSAENIRYDKRPRSSGAFGLLSRRHCPGGTGGPDGLPRPATTEAVTTHGLFLYAGIYDELADAEADAASIHDRHRQGELGTYDVAIVRRTERGHVRVHQHEVPSERGAWLGLVAGAVVGIVFPATLVATAIWAGAGAAFGGLVGHLASGIPRSDLYEIGAGLDSGEVALVMVTRDPLPVEANSVLPRARECLERRLGVDADELQRHVEQTFDERAGSSSASSKAEVPAGPGGGGTTDGQSEAVSHDA
jgi:uncharacterized membrane protein